MNTKLAELQQLKRRGEKIAALTAYDFPTARLLHESGVDVLLVGDSLGMVVLGYPDTTHVTMAEMIHHTRAVARGAPDALIVADLPFASYETNDQAVEHSQRLIEAGALAVKLEGGLEQCGKIEAIANADIPVMAHLGMLPQSIRTEGTYKVKGKTPREAEQLLGDAASVARAGAFAIVLELVQPALAKEITAHSEIPTIGIGSGQDCDGQVLVTHDLVGLFPWFTPRFVTARASVAAEIRRAATEFRAMVKAQT